MNIATVNARAINGINQFTDEQLLSAYNNLLKAKPQLPHLRRARLCILDLLEARGRARDAFVASLKSTPQGR